MRRTVEDAEVREISRLVTMTIATVSTKAVSYRSKVHDHALLDAYVGFALSLAEGDGGVRDRSDRAYLIHVTVDEGVRRAL